MTEGEGGVNFGSNLGVVIVNWPLSLNQIIFDKEPKKNSLFSDELSQDQKCSERIFFQKYSLLLLH